MAHAKRYFMPGHAWHITHRCHKREFLLKFQKNRRRWIEWLFQSKKRYSFTILMHFAGWKSIQDNSVLRSKLQLVYEFLRQMLIVPQLFLIIFIAQIFLSFSFPSAAADRNYNASKMSSLNSSHKQTNRQSVYYMPEGVNKARLSSVQIRSNLEGRRERIGSGFLWKAQNKVITSLHVVAGSDEIWVTDSKQKLSKAHISRLSVPYDLVELSLETPSQGTPLTEFGDLESFPRWGISDSEQNNQLKSTSLLWVLGNPYGTLHMAVDEMYGAELVPLKRIVTGPVKKELYNLGRFDLGPDIGIIVLRVSGALVPGHSGAPMIDEEGRLVAIANGGLDYGRTDRTWAIPATAIGNLDVATDWIRKHSKQERYSAAAPFFFNTTSTSEVERLSTLLGLVRDQKIHAKSLVIALERLTIQGYRFDGFIFEGEKQLDGLTVPHIGASQSSWRNSDLSGADFSKSDLSNSDFRNANLSGVNFYKADLREADFRGASLYKANLEDTLLSGAILNKYQLKSTCQSSSANSKQSPEKWDPSTRSILLFPSEFSWINILASEEENPVPKTSLSGIEASSSVFEFRKRIPLYDVKIPGEPNIGLLLSFGVYYGIMTWKSGVGRPTAKVNRYGLRLSPLGFSYDFNYKWSLFGLFPFSAGYWDLTNNDEVKGNQDYSGWEFGLGPEIGGSYRLDMDDPLPPLIITLSTSIMFHAVSNHFKYGGEGNEIEYSNFSIRIGLGFVL